MSNNKTLASQLDESRNPHTIMIPNKMVPPPLKSPERRSPPCSRGRTMKEFEEELVELRRENFDLKMRIYLMEEQQELLHGSSAIDDVQKIRNLNQELLNVKKDLAEKEELILQAGKAMELLDVKHKDDLLKLENKFIKERENYKTTLQQLEEELKGVRKSSKGDGPSQFDDSNAMYAMAFGLQPLKSPSKERDHIASLEIQLAKLEKELHEECLHRQEAEELIGKLQSDILSAQELYNRTKVELASKLRDLERAEGKIEELKTTVKQANQMSEEATLTVELKKRMANEERTIILTTQSKLEAALLKNAELQDQIVDLTRKLTDAEQMKASYKSVQMSRAIQNGVSPSSSETEDFVKLRSQLESKTTENNSLSSENKKLLMGMRGLMMQNKTLLKELKSVGKNRLAESDESASSTSSRSARHSASSDSETLLQNLKEKELRIQGFEAPECKGEKDNRISQLEKEMENLKVQLESVSDSSVLIRLESEKGKLKEEIVAKNREIDHLHEELRKRTFNLQELVNTELWDKNREIEKLNKSCERKQLEVSSLRHKLKLKDTQVEQLEEKVRELNGKDYLGEIEKLKTECAHWKENSEQSEKSRKELINACTLLTTRLEELSTFLDSLLPSLGEKKRIQLQKAIEQSREVSRSFSFSLRDQSDLSISIPILPDFSQVDFFSGEDSGGVTEEAKDNPEILQNDEVVRLRTQVESLVEKLKQKDSAVAAAKQSPKRSFTMWSSTNDPSFELMSEGLEDVTEGSVLETFDSDTTQEKDLRIVSPRTAGSPAHPAREDTPPRPLSRCLSESEGWSEPDRDVSLARIGIREESVLRGGLTAAEESSSSVRRSISAPSSGKKSRHDFCEIRRLNMRMRSLEQINEALRTEIRALCSSNMLIKVDKAVSCQMTEDLSTSLLDEIRSQREKLQMSLSHNEEIRNHLEGSKVALSEESLVEELKLMSDQLEEAYKWCLQLEEKCINFENECRTLKSQVKYGEDRNSRLSEELSQLRSELKEKENEALEKQCVALEARNSALVLESRLKAAESGLEEASRKWKILEDAARDAERCYTEAVGRCKQAETRVQSLLSQLSSTQAENKAIQEHYAEEESKLKARLGQLKRELDTISSEHEEMVVSANQKIEELTRLKLTMEDEWKQKMEEVVKEKRVEIDGEIVKRMEAEKKLAASYETQAELRTKLEIELAKCREIDATKKLEDRLWRRRLSQLEARHSVIEGELRRKLDSATLTTSEAILDRTRLANEKIKLQQQIRANNDISNEMKVELEQRVTELEAANTELSSRLEEIGHNQLLRQPSNPTSDYMSDQEPQTSSSVNLWFPLCGRSNNNSSPDLGIESDQGRLSSLDPMPIANNNHNQVDIAKLEMENEELMRQLNRTRRALEEALSRVTSANQKKREMEKAICKQLHKTHHILQKARVNFESDPQ